MYDAALAALEAEGAVLVEDPFAGTNFASLALPGDDYDYRGTESLPYDFELYLQRLGPSAAASSIAELQGLLELDPLSDEGPLGSYYAERLPVYVESRSDPTVPPDLSEFTSLRNEYLSAFNAVMEDNDLDLLVLPQASGELPGIFSEDSYPDTTVSEINILGTPGVTVPAGQFENGSPFSLIFMGPMWSEAELLGYAYDYEQATHNRVVPELVTEPYEDAPVAE